MPAVVQPKTIQEMLDMLTEHLHGEESEVWSHALRLLLAKKNPWTTSRSPWPLWKRIPLRPGCNWDELMSALMLRTEMVWDSSIRTLPQRFPHINFNATGEVSGDFVLVSPLDVSYGEEILRFLNHIQTDHGLLLCTPAMAVELRLAYEPLHGEHLIVATENIGHLHHPNATIQYDLFSLCYNSFRFVQHPPLLVDPAQRFIFRLPAE